MTAVVGKRFVDNLPSYYSGKCSYWHDRESHIRAFKCNEYMTPESVDYLLEKGFRRCGDLFYVTDCAPCNGCISYRLNPAHAVFSKSQKRILKKGRNVIIKITEPEITELKIEMYLKYQKHKHPENAESKDDSVMINSLKTQMFENYGNSIQFEFYIEDRLIGFMTADIGVTSLSAVYSVYDIDFLHMSPGKLFILKIIEWMKNKYELFYLGFYIEKHCKMNYKCEFQKATILDPIDDTWKDFQVRENKFSQMESE